MNRLRLKSTPNTWYDGIVPLATIVLEVEPSLLYLIADSEDPAAVWQRLSGQFQKTWANKLSLRKRLFAMKLSDSESMRENIKRMTDIYLTNWK